MVDNRQDFWRVGTMATFLVLAGAVTSGCTIDAATTVVEDRPFNNVVADTETKANIIKRLLGAKNNDLFFDVSADAYEGRVMLTGSVKLERDRERAAALAHSPAFVRWAAGRRNDFPDHEALRAEVETIITYRRFADDMMAAYMTAAVEPGPDGGLTLRCPGAIEAAIYANCPDSGIFEQTARVATRTRIFATDQTVLPDLHSWAPGTMIAIAANMPRAEARTMPGCLHLMAQEDPDACATAIIDHALG